LARLSIFHANQTIYKTIADGMVLFLALVAANAAIDPKALQLGNTTAAELVARIAQAYGIELPRLAQG